MNKENIIIIKGVIFSKIEHALNKWINLNSEYFESEFNFYIYNDAKGTYIIKLYKNLGIQYYVSLVKSLKFTNDNNSNIFIESYIKVGEDEIFTPELINKKILLYISHSDKESDNVFAVSEDNINYKIDSAGKALKISNSQTYSKPEIDFDKLPVPEIINVKYFIDKINYKKDSEYKIDKRFKIGLLIISVFFLITQFTSFDMELFIRNNAVLCFLNYFQSKKIVKRQKIFILMK